MSAADPQWPAWLRRHTAVEFLGPPRLFFAWLTIALSLMMIVYVGAWNAAKYPIVLGYDARPNIEYAHFLLDKHRIPRPDESGESNQPPAYYFVAGVASRAGHKIFGWLEARPFTAQLPEASYRGAQILNVVLVFLTALCVLWLARVVAPDRPWVWASSVGFFAFLPAVTKTEAMFHPDNLGMLAAALALASTTHMSVRRVFPRRLLALLAISLGLGLATRLSGIFVLLAIALGTALACTASELRAVLPWRRIVIVLAVLILLPSPWVAYRAIVQHAGPLNETSRLVHAALHPSTHTLSDFNTTHKHFFDLSPRLVFTSPWRSNYLNEALPETYTEIWGDWLGSFSWSSYSFTPSEPAQKVLKDQSYIGVLPTAFAMCGWLGLCGMAFRRRGLAAAALLPLISIAGYLYRAFVSLTHDGDLFKSAYILNTAPVWSLSFGLATAWLASRSRLGRVAMLVLFPIFAILELRFIMYGIRDGVPIF